MKKNNFIKGIIFGFALFCTIMLVSCSTKTEFIIKFMVDETEYDSVTTSGSEMIRMPENPTKEGYTFKGWYWDKGTWTNDFTANSLLDTPLSSDMKVYACFVSESAVTGVEMNVKDSFHMNLQGVGDVFYCKVPNSQFIFKFNDYVEIDPTSTWNVSTDITGNNTIASKTVELKIGDNSLYYIYVTDKNNQHETYVILIHRKYMYDVSFNSNGGTSCQPVQVEEDSYLDSIPSTTKTGYTFMGWDFDFETTKITKNITANAKWEANKYTITFDANGGYCSNKSMNVTFNNNYELPIPSLKGNTFVGWYSINGELFKNQKWNRTSDVTLYAKWSPNTYSITYDLNQGIWNSGSMLTSYTYGSEVAIGEPIKTGYTFVGWCVNYSNDVVKEYRITSDTFGDIKLTAVYETNKFTISFDVNGGECSLTNMTVEYGKEYSLPTATRTGYTFKGWYNGSTKVDNGIWKRESSIDLQALWEITNYIIEYELDGGVNNSKNPTSFTFETNDINIGEPAKVGYAFIGWTNDDITTPVKEVSISKGSTNNVKLIANWKANEYKVKLDVNGGDKLEIDEITVAYDSNLNLPTPNKIGYTFTGWYNNESKISGKWIYLTDLNLKAKWTITNYNITYKLNNGVNDKSNPVTYTYESPNIVIKDATKVGYTFVGWTTSGSTELVKNFTIPANSTGDYELTANYEANTYYINYDVNGGIDLANTNIVVVYASSYTLVEPSKTGYTFEGWYEGNNLFTNGTWNRTSDINLKAKWNAIIYSITYNLDGGKNNSYNPSRYNYEYEDIVINEPTKTGYTFLGWTTEESNVPNKELTIAHNSVGNKVLTANWQVNTYYINYDVNDGNELANSEIAVEYGSSYTLVEPSRTEYVFAGWYEGDNLFINGTWNRTSDVNLKAKWNVIVYTITYNLDGGTTTNPVNYNYDSDDFVLSEPTKIGYTFIGWTNDNIFVPKKNIEIKNHSTGNLSFTANWEINQYTLTVRIDDEELAITQDYDTILQIDVPTYTRRGSVITGWSETIPTRMPAENKTIKAIWKCPVKYIVTSDKAIITGYNDSNNIVIFDSYDGYSTTSIEDYAFYNCTSLTSIIIPDGITSIGERAFWNCTNLTNITIPDSVAYIGENAFSNCSKLQYNQYNNALYLGNEANKYVVFIGANDSNLSTYNINESTKIIYCYAFNSKTNLTNLTIPNNVKSIGNYAFRSCTSLTSITLSTSLTSIGHHSFYYCTSLTNITLPKSLTNIEGEAFSDCKKLTNIIIPNNVTSIGIAAFSNCTSLKNITIPNSVTSIGDSAFYGCTNLTSITLPDSVTSIGDSAFSNCTSLTSVTIPNNVISIGPYVFNNCTNLQYTEYGNALYLGNETNRYLVLVKAKNSSITSCTINESTKLIGYGAFSDCTNLQYAEYGNALYLGNETNRYLVLVKAKNSSITSCSINESTKFIHSYAFEKCTTLTSITIPNSVTNIGNLAFWNCTSLTSITIPDSVISIGDSAFSNCTSLTNVTIGNSVTLLGQGSFRDCTKLTSITIPDNITSIKDITFYTCTSLTSITIPDSVTSIGGVAFAKCANLSNITYQGTKSQWYCISKVNSWDNETGNYTIHCTDGDIAKE